MVDFPRFLFIKKMISIIVTIEMLPVISRNNEMIVPMAMAAVISVIIEQKNQIHNDFSAEEQCTSVLLP